MIVALRFWLLLLQAVFLMESISNGKITLEEAKNDQYETLK